jgi:transcriptional regulator with XRE-family HTH domain
MEKTKTLGERIRELRAAKDISLRELAKKIDVSAAFLSDVELGRRNPSESHLGKIAQVLGVHEDDFKAYDTRAPITELRKLVASDPKFGLAFRRMVDENANPDEIIKFLEERIKKKKSQ